MLWVRQQEIKRGLLRAKVAKQGKASNFDGAHSPKKQMHIQRRLNALDSTIRGGGAGII